MCIIAKIKSAQAVLEQVGNNSELIEQVGAEYNNVNFKGALILADILLEAAVKSVLTPDFLYAELNKGQCKIEYRKADGSIRKAIATLSSEHGCPDHDRSKRDPKKAHLLTYFDIESDGFRACKIETITEFSRVLKAGK